MPDDDQLGATLPDTPQSSAQSYDLPRVLAIPPAERYSPVRVLGQGGMGEVMLVADRVIGRDVALKRMRYDIDEGRDQFAREALLQGRLEHPSIVPVYDVARDPDGAPFFTMRRVHGHSLADVLSSTTIEFSRVRLLQVFNQICLAAHFAHEHGIVHCDIKPANIMLGDFGEVYLLDWGIARTPLDASDGVAGTVAYMSPEQARGERRLDRRSDIYALGAILFEILTRTPLHEAAPIAQVLARIEEGVDARASVRAPSADVPPELEAICLKATAKQAAGRHATARELADEVERYLEGDRDVALRRRMSGELAARASELAARDSETTALRSEALATVGRALALDPNNVDALATLVQLLTTPPREMPAEALAELRATERRFDRIRGRSGFTALLLWFVGTIVGGAIAGVHDTRAFAVTLAAIAIAVVASSHRVRRPPVDGNAPTYVIVATAIAITGMGLGFSPWLLTPPLALTFTIATTLSVDEPRRYFPVIATCIALVLPLVVEWLGLVGPSLVNDGALLCVVPRMSELPETTAARMIPLAVSLGCVAMGGLFGVRLRGTLLAVQRHNAIQAWQLRQLIPKAAGAVTTLQSGPRAAVG